MKEKRFERHVLRFVCALALIRMLIELYTDVIRDVSLAAYITDGGILAIVLLFFCLSFTLVRIDLQIIAFSLLVTAVMSINWIQTGGLESHSEYNFLALVIVIGMIHSGRSLVVFCGIVLLTELGLLIAWQFGRDYLELLVLNPSPRVIQYIGIMVFAAATVLYLKFKHDKEGQRLSEQRAILSNRIMELDIENNNLQIQQQQYESVTEKLEDEIAARKKELQAQNESLQKFIDISIKEFYPPLQNTLRAIEDLRAFSSSNENIEMLTRSGYKLDKAYQGLKTKMRDNIQ